MKKLIAFLSAAVLALSLVSCADNDEKITLGTIADGPLVDPFAQITQAPAENSSAVEDDTSIDTKANEDTADTEISDLEISDTSASVPTEEDEGLASDRPSLNIEIGNATVILNGKDITSTCYASVDKDKKTAEIALTSIMKELGKTVTTEENKITMQRENGEIVFDTALPDFGLPRVPDSAFFVRKIVNGEVVVDRTSANPFVREAGYSIKINYDSAIIHILPLE